MDEPPRQSVVKTYLYGREDSAARIAKREGKSRVWVSANRQPAPEPTFDKDGYPTDESLQIIRDWKITSNFAIKDLLAYAEKCWRYKFKIRARGTGQKRWIYIATSGWSGNEDVIRALQDNRVFWALCWLESRRGGGFKFLTSPVKES